MLHIETTWGSIEVDLIDGRVVHCALPFLAGQPETPFAVKAGGSDPASKFVIAALNGKTAGKPALGKPEGTDFQEQVWQAIARIPAGKTISYGELAIAIGRPRAYRAVANACGRNPLPVFIPCHRVVATHGKIGGFSSGLAWKRLLLTAEQA
jgi:O-6-methylguanine DNA methyltransferase